MKILKPLFYSGQVLKFEDQLKQLESSLSDAKRSAKVLAQELEKKREVIQKKDAESSLAKDNIRMKVDEVGISIISDPIERSYFKIRCSENNIY